jgi:beta-glucanase (GH16 family)
VRISARIKLPTGYGMWPAFWSYTEPWPVHGEIDIMEARGQKPFEYQTNYFYGTEAYKNILVNKVAYMRSNVSLTDCYHVYEVIWAKNTLSFLFDGKVIETKAGEYVPKIFGKTHRLILNLSVGGNMFSGSFFKFDASKIKTGVMYVDWVKVFTSK